MPPILRSILGVVAGFLTLNIILFISTPASIAIQRLQSGHHASGTLAFSIVWSFAASFAAGYVCALIAAENRIETAGVFAAIMLVFGVFSYLHYTGRQSVWYQIMIVVIPPMLIVAGGALCTRNARGWVAREA